jgi:hypothetical protein
MKKGDMESIRVNKAELITTMKANRAEHRKIVDEAIEGYREQALALLEKHITQIKDGKVARVYVVLPEIEDHTKDYDRVIGMLEMSLDTEVELDEHDYSQYIMDDWAWKRQFLTSNSSYSASAAYFADRVSDSR